MLAVLVGLPLTGRAQAPELGLWSGVSLEKKVKKSFSLHLNGQTRLADDLTVLRSYLVEAGAGYQFNKHWETTLYYRYTGRRRRDPATDAYAYQPYHRFYGDVAYDHTLWKLKLTNRVRYQHQFRDDADADDDRSSYLRNKLELSYPNKTRFTPYVSTDVFYQLGTGFDQLRNRAGLQISLTRHHKLDLFGFTDYQLIERQQNRLTLGLQYQVKF